MSFDRALQEGDLEEARRLLDELASQRDGDGFRVSECYAELAQAFDRAGRHDEAVVAMERAIEHGWSGRPDGRSDVAEFHLRAGRAEEAARIWAELKAEDPGEIWVYNAAGLSYSEAGEHELAAKWLGEGIQLGIRTGDPEGIVAQLSGVRVRSLQALGREPDELDAQVEPFLEEMRARDHERQSRARVFTALDEATPTAEDAQRASNGGGGAVALAWFPAGEYERAIVRWESLAEDWRQIAHAEYCRRLEGHAKWMRAQGMPARAIAPIIVEEFIAWCEEHDHSTEDARAVYAAHLLAGGDAIPWPPGRNEACWCGSQRKYKKCCASAPAAPMHAA